MIRSIAIIAGFVAFGAAFAPVAQAQTPTSFVAIHDLTVEGRDPPAYLRRTLDDNTTGVMRDFDVCYAARHALRADLAGEFSLRLWVSSRQVIRVTPEGDTVGDPELYTCVKTRLLAMTLPPDAPTAGATVRLRVQFTAPAAGTIVRCVGRDCSAVRCGAVGAPCCPANACSGAGLACVDSTCAVPPPPPPPPETATVTVSRVRGALTAEAVTALVPSSLFSTCITPEVTREGTYTVTFARTGRVTVTTTRSMRPTTAQTCVRNVLRALTPGAQARSTTARIVVARATTP